VKGELNMIKVLCLRASNGGEKYVVKINENITSFSADRLIRLLARPHYSQYQIQAVYEFACKDDCYFSANLELMAAFEKLYNAINYQLDCAKEFEVLWQYWVK
jgi:hypothetical protein